MTPRTRSETQVKPSWLLSAFFGAAVLTIGLDQYRPVLASVGNLSDILFLTVFILGGALWIARLDSQRLRGLWNAVLQAEPFIWGGVLLTLGGGIASLGSDAPSLSWRVTLKYFAMFCVWLPWIAVAVERYLSVTRARVLYVAGFCLIALATLSDLLMGTHAGARLVSTPVYQVDLENLAEVVRYGGPTGHPNTLGYVSTIGLLLCLSVSTASSWRRAWVPLLGLVTCGATLVVSGSRAAFLGAVTGCFILFVLSGRRGRQRVLVVTVMCLATLWIVSSVTDVGRVVNPFKRLAESVQARRGFEADWQRRQDLRLTQRLLSHDPLTGYGMEDIGTSSPRTKVAFNLPHWVVLQSWVAGGVLALLGTLWLYSITLWLGWRAVRADRSMALGLFASSVAFILMDMVHPGLDQRFKWFSAALLIATLRNSRQASKGAEIPPSTA